MTEEHLQEEIGSEPETEPEADNTPQREFVKAEYFDEPRLCRLLTFQREDAKTLGAKFADKWGKTNRVVLMDYNDEKEKVIENSAYSFYLDWKRGNVRPEQDFVVFSIKFGHPYDEEKNFRRWIFQPVFKPNETNND